MKMELPLKYREWFQEKDQSLFIQMFSTSWPCLFPVNFILVHDILCGHLWYQHKHNHKQQFERCFCLSRFIKIVSDIYVFSFETFFFKFNLTLHKIARIILASLLKVAIKSKWICWLTSNDFLLVSRNSHNTHLAEHSMAQNLLVANSNWENCVNVATMFLVTVWVNGGGGIVNLLFRIIFYKNREYKNHQG